MLSVLNKRDPPHSNMQPPEKLSAYIRDAIADLKRKVEAPKPKAAAGAVMPTSALYQNAIAKWIESLTPLQRFRRFSMIEIIKLAGTSGINGKAASVQLMGDALHACGFVQSRDWTKAGRNRRYWVMKNIQ